MAVYALFEAGMKNEWIAAISDLRNHF